LPGLEDVVKYIDQKGYGKDTIVLTMGAGDIYKVKDNLKFKNET
jgi:UDP-N-acetylmuramate-alanine ligase